MLIVARHVAHACRARPRAAPARRRLRGPPRRPERRGSRLAWLHRSLPPPSCLSTRAARGVRSARRACSCCVTAALSIPAILAATTWIGKYAGDYTSGDQYGNLRGTLSWLQAFGIWPTGDFRFRPEDLRPTYVLVAVVVAFIVVAVATAWRRRIVDDPPRRAHCGLRMRLLRRSRRRRGSSRRRSRRRARSCSRSRSQVSPPCSRAVDAPRHLSPRPLSSPA